MKHRLLFYNTLERTFQQHELAANEGKVTVVAIIRLWSYNKCNNNNTKCFVFDHNVL